MLRYVAVVLVAIIGGLVCFDIGIKKQRVDVAIVPTSFDHITLQLERLISRSSLVYLYL